MFDPEWIDRNDPVWPGRTAPVGAQAGAERLGATVYEIAPGSAGSPPHAHHANDELIIVLAGRPVLMAADDWPSGRSLRVLSAGGAHQLRNDSDGPIRVLVVSA